MRMQSEFPSMPDARTFCQLVMVSTKAAPRCSKKDPEPVAPFTALDLSWSEKPAPNKTIRPMSGPTSKNFKAPLR
jgi:hypothetical protein